MTAGRVERVIGGPPLQLTLAGLAVPAQLENPDQPGRLEGTHGPVTVRRWRSDPDSRPEPATCSVTVSARALAAAGYVGPPQLGDELLVDLSPAAGAWLGLTPEQLPALRRFAGRLTDAEAIPETAGGGPALYKLAAAGPSARLGRLTIGEPPWPVELDGQRVERVLSAAAAQVDDLVIGDVDAGTVSVLARDVDAQSAASLLDELAVSGGGELVELRDGTIEFHDAEHRRDAPSLVELTAGEVLAPASWKSTLAGLVNDLTLTYGAESALSVQLADQVAAGGPLGRLAAKLTTQLAAEADAQQRLHDLLGRRSRQRWRIDQLPVDLVASVSPAKAGLLLGSTFGDLVDVVGFPAAGPFAVAALWIEGQTETITARSWRLDLAVSEFGLTAPAPRFVDVADVHSIGGVPDDVSILAATGWWPESGRQSAGRFVDVPAGLDIRDAPDAELLGSSSY